MPALRITTNVLATVAAVLLGTTALCSSANAVPVTLNYRWQVRSIDDPQNLLQGAFLTGSILTGSMTYENTTPDSNPDPQRGRYENPLLGGSLGNASFDFHFDPSLKLPNSTLSSLFSISNQPRDWTHFGWSAAALSSTGLYTTIGANSDLVHLPSDAITELDVAPRRIDSSAGSIYIYSDSSFLQPVANLYLEQWGNVWVTPIPSAVWLFGSALGVMGLMRRKLSG